MVAPEGRVSGAVWVSAKTRDPEGEDWVLSLNGLILMINNIGKPFPATSCMTGKE
jgi:hypothetical protein